MASMGAERVPFLLPPYRSWDGSESVVSQVATPVDGVAAVASDVRTPVWVCCYGRPVSNVRYRRVCVLRAWFGQWCHVYVCRAYTWLRVCCCWGEARTRCAVWLFAVGSLRDFPESLAEGIDIPLCASGPQPRQFGGVCLTSEHRHHAIPSYIT